jgi:hypothetical protein
MTVRCLGARPIPVWRDGPTVRLAKEYEAIMARTVGPFGRKYHADVAELMMVPDASSAVSGTITGPSMSYLGVEIITIHDVSPKIEDFLLLILD